MMAQLTSRYTRYAPLLGLACILIALGGWLVVGEASLWIEILGTVGLLLIALTIALRPAEVRAALTGRQAKYGGNAALMSVSFLLILVLINFLGSRHHQRWDVTEEKRFSLSEQTLQLLDSLEEPVHVKLFFTPGHYNRQQAEDLIKEYELRSDKLSYEFVDPDIDRRIALEYQIGRDGTIIFERGGRREVIFGVGEQDFSSALLQVSRDEKRTVKFLTGHQERSPDSYDQGGYSTIKQVLERENYVVGTVNLMATEALTDSMDVLVIASPRQALAPEEVEKLSQLVEDGVSFLVLVDPGMPDPFGGFLESFGIVLKDDLVIDPAKSFFGDVTSPLVDHYTFHQITKDLEGLTTILPTARSLARRDPPPEDWQVQVLAESSERSWAETGYREQNVRQDAEEAAGPLPLIAAIEPTTESGGRGRLVIVGDGSFVENQLLNTVRGNLGNVDIFMNAVGWLAEEESLISIRPKMPEQRQVFLTPPQARGIIYSSILFVPLLVLAAGAIVWWQRR